MTDSLPLRLRVALGHVAEIDDEEAATGGRRVFLARGRQDDPSRPATRRVILHPAPPDGPTPDALHRRADQLLVLTHPTIAAPVATGVFEGRGWVVDPIPPGMPLATRLAERGTLSLREAVGVLRDVTRALTALHRRGLAHGHLTAATVLLESRGTVLAGLGLEASGLPADDLHALGLLAWEMLVGAPFRGSGERGLRAYRPSASPQLEALIVGLVEREGAPRPAKAAEVLAALDHFPPLAPALIADFLDGIGSGGRGGRRDWQGFGSVSRAAGALLGRLRGR